MHQVSHKFPYLKFFYSMWTSSSDTGLSSKGSLTTLKSCFIFLQVNTFSFEIHESFLHYIFFRYTLSVNIIWAVAQWRSMNSLCQKSCFLIFRTIKYAGKMENQLLINSAHHIIAIQDSFEKGEKMRSHREPNDSLHYPIPHNNKIYQTCYKYYKNRSNISYWPNNQVNGTEEGYKIKAVKPWRKKQL